MIYKTEYQMLNVAEIVPAPYNPREDMLAGSAAYQALRQSIEEHGLVEPLVVNLCNMHCVGGNQRLTVVRDLGWPQVLCSVINQPDEAQEKKLCLALNRIDGHWDEAKLAELLSDEAVAAYTTGFSPAEIALYQQLAEIHEPEPLSETEADLLAQLDNHIEDEAAAPAEAAIAVDLAGAAILEPQTLLIKIGHLSFKCEMTAYKKLLADIRAAGLFEKGQIVQEMKRRLLGND